MSGLPYSVRMFLPPSPLSRPAHRWWRNTRGEDWPGSGCLDDRSGRPGVTAEANAISGRQLLGGDVNGSVARRSAIRLPASPMPDSGSDG